MEAFIRSPIFENWIEKHKPKSKLIICSPFIKESALSDIFNLYGVFGSNIDVSVLTGGRKDVFVQGGSDISAVRLMAGIANAKVYLVDNLHMKAYCIDDTRLLITSGNCTKNGLYAGGNIEAGISTNNPKKISDFMGYFQEAINASRKLENADEIISYCEEYDIWLTENKEIAETTKQSIKSLQELAKFRVSKYKLRITSNKPARKKRYVFKSSDLSSMRQAIIVKAPLDFDNISNEVAYFIGGIIISGAETHTINEKEHFIIPFRKNNKPNDEEFVNRVNSHQEKVLDLIDCFARSVENHLASELNVNLGFSALVGFATLFPVITPIINREDFVNALLEKMLDMDLPTIKCCLIGMFDSKGYIDRHRKLIGMDVDGEFLGKAIGKLISKFNLQFNLNPMRERESGKGEPRKMQLRIKLSEYCKTFGVISPNKLLQIENTLVSAKMVDVDEILPGLKKMEERSNGN
jgi:hypothetical protein